LFSACVSYAHEAMQVHEHPHGHHNGPNGVLLHGARMRGAPAAAMGQNGTGSHNCGWCSLGCPTAAKQGSLHAMLPRAQAQGARVIANCTVSRITHARAPRTAPSKAGTDSVALRVGDRAIPLHAHAEAASPGSLHAPYLVPAAQRTVTGVEAIVRIPVRAPSAATAVASGPGVPVAAPTYTVRTLPLVIRAPVVISAAGALQTPVLLRRSGLRNPHIGRHLRLHPVCGVTGTYGPGHAHPLGNAFTSARRAEAATAPAVLDPASAASPDEICPYEGCQMTSVDSSAADVHGDGYGCRVETPAVHVALAAFAMRWGGQRGFFEEKEKTLVDVDTVDTGRSNSKKSLSGDGGRRVLHPAHQRYGARFKEMMCSFRRVAPMICLTR
jgi:hypothetical protein